MSLTTAHRDIEAALNATGRFNQVGTWLGDIQSLIDTTKATPSVFVILSDMEFDGPIALKQAAAISDTLWSTIIFEYVSNTSDGDIPAYTSIETTVAAITNLRVGSNRRLWPVRAKLLGSTKNSVVAYGIQFSLI